MYRIIQVVQAAAVETQRPFNPSGSPPVSPQLPFGRRLRELRRAKGITQRALAEHARIDFTYLSKLENDRLAPPSAATAAALARALGADVDELCVLAGQVPPDIADLFSRDLVAAKVFRALVAAGVFRFESPEGWQDDDPALAVYDCALASARAAMSDALAQGVDRTVARQAYSRAIVDAVRVLRESPRSAPTAQAS